jgi:hypothetical protein
MGPAVYDLTGPGVEVVPGRRYANACRFTMSGGRQRRRSTHSSLILMFLNQMA